MNDWVAHLVADKDLVLLYEINLLKADLNTYNREVASEQTIKHKYQI